MPGERPGLLVEALAVTRRRSTPPTDRRAERATSALPRHLVALLTAMGVLLLGGFSAAAADDLLSTTPATSAVLWGMDDGTSFDQTEAAMGRQFSMVREYRRIDQSFTSARMQALVDGGRSMMVSVKARNLSTYIPYSAITAGEYDDVFVDGLSALNALATPTYFAFQHEADSTAAQASCSSPGDTVVCGQEFVAAWRHIHDLSVAHGFSKVIFTWTVTSYGFNPQTGVRNNAYWPGTSYTDWIGVDAYNGGCNQSWYGSFEQMLAYTVGWAADHAPDMPIMLPEYGATEGSTPLAKAEFFTGIPTALSKPAYKNIKAVLYWNQAESACDFTIGSSTASYAAFRGLGLLPMMAARATDPIVVTTGSGDAPDVPPASSDPEPSTADPGPDPVTPPAASTPTPVKSAAPVRRYVRVRFDAASQRKNSVRLAAFMASSQRGAAVRFYRVAKGGHLVYCGTGHANSGGNAFLTKHYQHGSGKLYTFVSVVLPKGSYRDTRSNRNKARIH